MNFTKLQGTGNDFILVETSDIQRGWSQVAMAICDRHFGVGADGLLLALPSAVADFQMRMFNPDGSEAEACGKARLGIGGGPDAPGLRGASCAGHGSIR